MDIQREIAQVLMKRDPATVTEHVRRLRVKLEDDPSLPQMIQTVRSAGYRFVPPADEPVLGR